MKLFRNIFIPIALLGSLLLSGCTEKEFSEITDLNLGRCLQPMNLNARVSASQGDVVTFSWDVTKDAETYLFTVLDSDGSSYLSEEVAPGTVPFQRKLEADKSFTFTVQARAEGKGDSKLAEYGKVFKTFATKTNLYLKVADRTASSITLAWSKDVEDYTEVDRIEVCLPGAEEPLVTKTLGADEIAAASATVEGLSAGTEYVATLFFKSASRGQVNVWTAADVSGFTAVSTVDALKNAVKTAGAKILLKMEGSPYVIDALDIDAGFTLSGEDSADGTKPVVQGEFHIADTWADGGSLIFENIEFSGAPSPNAASGFGFAIQNKNGGTKEGKDVKEISYTNCVIAHYTKGLFYEWSKAMKIGSLVYDSCEITDNNPDGTQGGDGIDIRYTSTIGKIAIVNNTISNGFRTFFRNYPQSTGSPAATITEVQMENNTVFNLCTVDATNNAGVIAFSEIPGSFSFKNNLFIGMSGKSKFGSDNANHKKLSDLGLAASNNWYFDVAETFFNDAWPASGGAFTAISANPCFNAPAGLFNLNPDAEIAGKEVGASKWWTPYVEEPEDLTQGVLDGATTWNLGNARNWSGTIKKSMVRDGLLLVASESNPVVAENGCLSFGASVVTDRKQVPADNYLAFKVATPGSVIARATGEGSAHFYIATQPVAGGDVTVKGGVSPIADAPAAQKIVISDISDPSWVYICPTGEVALAELAWSMDVSPVNTALPAPSPVVDPTSFTAGEATDVTVSWEPVPNAASYSVVFNGKTYTVSAEPWQYVIEGKTTGMLDAGSYTVDVIANPGKDDIYNTESAAGTAAFAVLPKGGSEENAELVVKDVEGLLAAISAGKEDIILELGEYDLGGVLTVTAPLALKGPKTAVVKGAFKLSGAVGNFALTGLTVDAAGQGVFIELDATEGVTAENISVAGTVITGFAKSVIYASNTADKFQIENIMFDSVEVYNQGTGQGMFDLRNGKYQTFTLQNSTLTGGRDFLRIDGTCSLYSVLVKTNTMYNLNTTKNGNGIFYVRADATNYRVEKNLLLDMTSGTVIGKTGAKVPVMSGNYYYNCNDDVFFTGVMDKETALGGQGVILTVDPVKDAANNDFTVVNGVVMSAKVGAPKWNPSSSISFNGGFRVTSVDEFQAAMDAGKSQIIFAPGEYDLSADNITLGSGIVLKGETGAKIIVKQLNLAEGELGNILIDNLDITVGANNFIAVEAASTVDRLVVKDCYIRNTGKSVFYGNADGSSFNSVLFSNNVITGLGGGQGTFDIRKGAYTSVSISGNTIVGGRDFIRADAGKITGAVSITNNTFDGVTLNNGNGVLYVRSTPNSYVLKNNLFLNENGDNNLLSKAATANVIAPTEVAGNYFYNCTAEKFWTGVIDKDVALANGGVILANNPVKDAANGDYTLVDALCLASNVGAPRWNPNAGSVTSDITVANVAELANAIDAGKQGITLKAGTYDLREVLESGIITLLAPVSLQGSGRVEIIGGFKLGIGTTSFVAQNIIFNGVEKALGNTIEIAEATQLEKVQIVGCDIVAYAKSLFYGNGTDSKVALFDFRKNLVHGFGTGQGMIDVRKGVYDIVNISENSFFNGGRDFARIDANVAGSVAIVNNTFAACSVDAGNGLLWIRSLSADPTKYVVKKNLFLNIGNNSLLAKSGATVPTMSENWFFNVGEKFFTGAISQDVATGSNGGVLTEDPCAGSAEFKLTLTNAELKSADIGDPRWNSSSPRYIKKK